MRRMVITSFVRIVGKLWLPMCDAAQERILTAYDINNIRAYGDGHITRDAVEHWVMLNTGDFSTITDFMAEIEDGSQSYEFDWAIDDSEFVYCDCMFPEPEDA
jgi:hypothetical protein